MMAIGGSVRGGIYGTAPDLNPYAGNPTLSNSNGDVKWDIDFRSVYARILDNWLGADSVADPGAPTSATPGSTSSDVRSTGSRPRSARRPSHSIGPQIE